jgi:dihydrolipoamide dehydrogenase
MKQYSVIIIGAGSAGLTALSEVHKKTDNFLLINDGPYGTTCARVGCMPSKALIEAANAYHRRKDFAAFKIKRVDCLSIDIPEVLQRVRELRDSFVSMMVKYTDQLGDKNISGRATIVDANTVKVGDQTYHANKIIIATGSQPVIPGNWLKFGNRLLTTDNLFEQKDLPERIAVIGLGAIGCEMAQALSRLGVKVTGFDLLKRIAAISDQAVSDTLLSKLKTEFPVYLGKPAELNEVADGIEVSCGNTKVVVDKVLVSMGRKPSIANIGLDKLGVNIDKNGVPEFNPDTMQIGNLPVFIAGDVNGQRPLLHEAVDDGFIAGYNTLAEEVKGFKRRIPLAVVFSDPEVALVGQKFSSLEEDKIAIGQGNFAHDLRAISAEKNHGLIRIYADKESKIILGAEICGPAAENIAFALSIMIDRKMTVLDALGLPIYHPVYEETLRSALYGLYKKIYTKKQPALKLID